MRVLAEVLFARISGTELRFQFARFGLESQRDDPDKLVREFADRRLTTPDALRVVHSTSWRYEAGAIVLSYLVYSDRLPFRGRSRRIRLRALPNPEDGTNGHDRDRAVVSHALRHLAFLVAEDPGEYDARLSPATRRSLRALRPAAAGRVQHTSPAED